MTPHRNTVIHDILDRVPWQAFDALVKQHSSDKHVRKLPTKTQFIVLAYAQMAGIAGLRETVTVVNSHEAQLYHLGARPVKLSTLSDANTLRPSAVFETLFARMVALAHRSLRRDLNELVYLIDATSLKLNERSASWARFSAKVCGAKIHVIHDPDANQPIHAVFTVARVNDITVAQDMPIVPGATYVFDLGYYHFGWWQRMHEKQCRFVTRLKTNTKLTVTRERLVEPGLPVLSDRIGYLPGRQAKSRRNPFQDEVREVRVRTDTGKILRIVTNDLDAPAQEIADLYKRRWAIELYFRWIKQTLAIRKFIGISENAIRTQIFIALIVFLLMRMAHANQQAVDSPLAFIRLARAHLMTRRDIADLRRPERRGIRKPISPVPDPSAIQVAA
jgi:IS4 transposase